MGTSARHKKILLTALLALVLGGPWPWPAAHFASLVDIMWVGVGGQMRMVPVVMV